MLFLCAGSGKYPEVVPDFRKNLNAAQNFPQKDGRRSGKFSFFWAERFFFRARCFIMVSKYQLYLPAPAGSVGETMNKQQLAAKIWNAANKMRSKIEANEYKDYILGFIFYKFLSDQEEKYLRENGLAAEEFPDALREENEDVVSFCRENLGYFMAYEHLFSTWLAEGSDFSVGEVRTALSAFSRLLSPHHEKIFHRIFATLETGLSKLGESTGAQTKAISDLIQLIRDIPMDGRQDYDVLGYIYEYLISNFAANAGKKAGEFYTPHEVSRLMSDIIAHHLRGREHIKIYDPTSGSGSLLITIGQSAARYMTNKDNILYYAQELKENTYNLTRMNLIMRGIKPDNITARNGDTLEADWPWFDDADPAGTYDPLYVDAVVSNPPYSQHWNPQGKESEPRYRYGLAPVSKADYAFLLHDLYHLKPDGIMAIVLPHGVLFRGDADGEGEGKIRKNLIENNHISAIIGLPANIFFGTGIPTIIMILRQKRDTSDVLFVDASGEYIKEGKQNKLQASNIRRIADAVIRREDIPGFARVVSKEEIRANGYNLNIPRYIAGKDAAETWDIYASLYGGLPEAELDALAPYWDAFPGLRDRLFRRDGTPYAQPAHEDMAAAVRDDEGMRRFLADYRARFSDFVPAMAERLLADPASLDAVQEEDRLWEDIRRRLAGFSLIDPYAAYQRLDDAWSAVALDLEAIQTEGWEAVRAVEPRMVLKKAGGRDVEVQDGWQGRILPFDLVERCLFPEERAAIEKAEQDLAAVVAEEEDILDSLPEEEKDGPWVNESGTAFNPKELARRAEDILAGADTPETAALAGYLALLDRKAGKEEKLAYIAAHTEADWSAVEGKAPYAKGKVQARLRALRAAITLPDDTAEGMLLRADGLLAREKSLRADVKDREAALAELVRARIPELTDDEARRLLTEKWAAPLGASLTAMADAVPKRLADAVTALMEKYGVTALDIERKSRDAGRALASLMDDLAGSAYDEKGLAGWKSLFTED